MIMGDGMKYFFLSVMTVLLAWNLNGCARGSGTSGKMKAPQFSVNSVIDGQAFSLGQYKGKVVIVDIWATWCPPCRMEIPDIIQLYHNYSDVLQVIGLSVDKTTDPVREFYTNMKMNYPVAMATAEIVQSYGGVDAIPTTFIIDKHGLIAEKFVDTGITASLRR